MRSPTALTPSNSVDLRLASDTTESAPIATRCSWSVLVEKWMRSMPASERMKPRGLWIDLPMRDRIAPPCSLTLLAARGWTEPEQITVKSIHCTGSMQSICMKQLITTAKPVIPAVAGRDTVPLESATPPRQAARHAGRNPWRSSAAGSAW